jgi:hypothetical protein
MDHGDCSVDRLVGMTVTRLLDAKYSVRAVT